jgi:hypothetical protein
LLHKSIGKDDINSFRMECFKDINNIPGVIDRLFGTVKHSILDLMGSDVLGQNKLNLSIQMPLDEGSQLNIYTDIISGQSEYEVVEPVNYSV